FGNPLALLGDLGGSSLFGNRQSAIGNVERQDAKAPRRKKVFSSPLRPSPIFSADSASRRSSSIPSARRAGCIFVGWAPPTVGPDRGGRCPPYGDCRFAFFALPGIHQAIGPGSRSKL